jgi:hypothetical protein
MPKTRRSFGFGQKVAILKMYLVDKVPISDRVSVLVVGRKSGTRGHYRGGLPIFRRTKEGRLWNAHTRLMA